MIKFLRIAVIAEAITAVRLGALCDQWAASAARRLGKISERLPKRQGDDRLIILVAVMLLVLP